MKKILSNDELIKKASEEIQRDLVAPDTVLLLIERLDAAERRIKILVALCTA